MRVKSLPAVELLLGDGHTFTDLQEPPVVVLGDDAQAFFVAESGQLFCAELCSMLEGHACLDVAYDVVFVAAAWSVLVCLHEDGVVVKWHAGLGDAVYLVGHFEKMEIGFVDR